ncbi:FAD-dependent oxidoreductase [Mycolicibacterium parafortuitum]|uniref:Amine oxidase [Nocardia brasiliensis ATCC] n=1 Tax=Mycolicibacterium parafortuitum TaxID=39692 RepID=A0A375YRV3_MYCPF|nr:FAD-dependent oxidoreductase [Mycolicibacterium parafortuitum]ORB27517.1 isorenieratene synthase [Mycolicibacterium parafortuitum]SRX83846.1 amine oxidase [Nocardia brasiliensis ATCC] [Mycolicibacterium parafortuitum]
MNDPRRVLHPAAPGLPGAADLVSRPTVAVVGGGIAGLAAATALAERGVAVRLYERQPYLGGRVGGWQTQLPDGTSAAMNRGFHAFFRQYYNLRDLLRRVDPTLSMLGPLDDYPLVDARGRRDTFRGLPRTPPFNAMAFALRSPTFRVRDLIRLDARAAAPLAAVSVPGTYDELDHQDAESFLRDINFPDAARHLAFEVFSRSFFTRPAKLSAAELATMFHIYFLGSSEGLVFDVATSNFDAALWNPLGSYLERLGARVQTGSSVRSVEPTADNAFVVTDDAGEQLRADGVVLAADVSALQAIVAGSPALGDPGWRGRIGRLGTAAPFVVQRLWLDRAVRSDRPAFMGTGGLPPLDNISVLERYEREAAEWCSRTGGSVVELHAYSVDEDTPALREASIARMHALYPETAQARIVHEETLCRNDCPRLAPGDFAERPSVHTPHPGLALAGDGIRIDLPVALMERAATTGISAANTLLAHFGVKGHDIYTVPVRGRSPVLRHLAGRVERRVPR